MAPLPNYGPRTALVVVDMQNDFADPAGSLFVQGGDEIISTVNQHIGQAQAAGSFVVYTQDWHPQATPHFDTGGGVWRVHCVAGTWGAALCEDLEVVGPVVQKGTNGEDGYSGFTMRDPVTEQEQPTELDSMLADRSIAEVVVVGLALDVCVKATALDAVANGYGVSVLTEAARAVNLEPGDGQTAIAELQNSGCQVIGQP